MDICKKKLSFIVSCISTRISIAASSLNTDLYNGQLKIGDTVYFKIVKYEKWSGFIFDVCSPPKYVAILEFYNNLNKKL